ncbi:MULTISPECIES: acyltransferase family protein [Caballeronia]|uniref:acyltransferase family protein n=1 Tax=Caballeronia TaxID=1827195 RepID=UPI00158A4AC6|nr:MULTISPECIES: acyltransferase [Caballeronia]MCG7400075.1 acyltransferase [Caballeronia zhejiangensis]MCI1043753.1 acyltransferase [Caballeronia zhejiangensis]
MRTLGQAFNKNGREDSNNFLLLRLIAASLVVYGHSFALAATTNGLRDFTTSILHYRYSGDLGLHIFFVISGFLITFSFDRRHSVKDFVISRALRLFPALVVCMALLAFVLGPSLTTLSRGIYFESPETYGFVWRNASLYEYAERLPGVFADNHARNAVNGTLWSIWVEVRLYVLVLVFGALGALRSRWVANLCIAALVAIGLFAPTYMPFITGDPSNLRVAVFFAAGVFLYVNRDFIPLNRQGLFALLLAAVLSYRQPAFEIACGAVIAYGVFMIAFAPKLNLGPIEDYSYGIYLYGWPIQQVVNHFHPDGSALQMMLIALPGSWLAGALSWYLIEKQALGLKARYSGAKKAKAAGGVAL